MRIDVILDSRAPATELRALGVLAERFGLAGIWVSSLNDSRDPWANLVPLALATERLRLGPVAVNPFDTHPVRIAAGLLTLNELAHGRARVVIGGGGEALAALGLAPERRVRAVRECLDILRLAASGGPVVHAGSLYRVRNVRFGWVTAPAPALYAGANQPQMLAMAAQAADGVMLSDLPPAPARAAVDSLQGAAVAAGRDPGELPTTVFMAWHVYADRDAARREARRWLLLRGIFRPWLLAEFLSPADVALVMASQPAFARAFATGSAEVEGVPDPVLDTLVEHLTCCGSPGDLPLFVDRLRQLQAAGLRSVALRLYTDPAASIRFIGREVLPALTRSAGG
jgi:alkanesulfonate monooxygenase SsuD/methylene tetrahydromethanopterin reductase-like flavin-dependent oxidoreductase (luciferase family)